MKKYFIITFLLSIAGIFISSLLLVQHFNVSSGILNIFCGDAIDNPCRSISSSGYSTLFNIPVASYAILFYCFIAITAIIVVYADDFYYNFGFVLLFPFISISLFVSIIFIVIMIKINTFCNLCAIIHLLNILLFLNFIFYYKFIKSDRNFKLTDFATEAIQSIKTISHAKAALSSYIILLLFLVVSVFSSTYIMDFRTAGNRVSNERLQKYEDMFKNTKTEEINLHKSNLIAGNREGILTITVFTDFLCTYCHDLHEIEEYLISEFNYRINFEYYNYPLDNECNNGINHTVYNNSCIASKAMLSAAGLGIFEKYLQTHFSNYKLLKSGYNLDMALSILDKSGYGNRKKEFLRLMNSKEITLQLEKDIDSAKKNKIKGTPTIFISNKRIRGLPPKDALEKIVYNEFMKRQTSQ